MEERTIEATETLEPQFGASPAAARATRDYRLQVDIGNYNLFVRGQKCGELWVEYDPGYAGAQDHTIEHWMLFSDYVAPSADNRDVSIQLVYEEGRYRDIGEFMARNRENPNTKYIRATCAVL